MKSRRQTAFSSIVFVAALAAAVGLVIAGCAAPPAQPAEAPAPTQLLSEPPTHTPVPPTPVPTQTPAPTETTPPQATAQPDLTATAVTTASLAHLWDGEIELPGAALKIVVAFRAQGDQFSGDIDIPAQGAIDLPLHDVAFDAPALHFEMLEGPQLAVFDGELQADGSIAGTFTQSGYTGDFTLTPQPVAAAEPVPYREEDITVTNGDVTLAGTLTLPEGSGPFPAVLLLTGSGQQNRDEELVIAPGYKPFRVLADALTRQGVAVLRYDDRGVGESTGDLSEVTTIDFAEDAEAVFDALRAHPEIDPEQVGLFGHSEGGIIAAMLAARNPDVAFVIGMGAPAVSGYDVLIKQVERLAAASGASAEDAAKAAEQERTLLDFTVAQDWQAAEDYLAQILLEQIEALPADQKAALGDPDKVVAERVAPQIEALKSPWFQTFLTYDIGKDWAKITVPVLALYGGLDAQVDADQNKPALEASLRQAKNPDVTVKVLPKANHLFQQATTGGVDEYATLPPDFVPGFLDTIGEWLLARVQRPQ